MPDPRRLGLLPAVGVPQPRPMFRTLGIAASGLTAQRMRMETIAQNLANADVTRTEDGGPYRRKSVVLREATAAEDPSRGPQPPALTGTIATPQAPFGSPVFQLPAVGDAQRAIPIPVVSGDDGLHGVAIDGIAESPANAGKLLYEPGHPDADENGYVRYPDVEPTQELVNLLDAKRLYEANATVFQTAKQMLRAALDI